MSPKYMEKNISQFKGSGMKVLYSLGLICVVVLFVLIASNKPPVYETLTVEMKPLTAEVSVSGSTEPPATIDLRFNQTGRIVERNVSIGEEVKTGDILARLDTSEFDAQIAEMHASVNIQKAKLNQLIAGSTDEDIELAQTKLDQAKRTQEIIVSNAYQTLLNSSLSATYVGNREGRGAPTISGTYFCGKEGSYLLEVYNSQGGQSVSYSGLESGTVSLDDIERPLGSCGLFISVPLNSEIDGNSPYLVNLPNTAGATYNANYSAYTQAVATEKSTIEQLQAELAVKQAAARPVDVAVYHAQIAQAEAALASVYAQKNNSLVIAPRDGIVTNYHGEVGETIGSDTVAVTMMPRGALQITLNISETKIAAVEVGQKARITLDAFGDTVFTGTVTEINPAETNIGGAIYYQAKVLFDTVYESVRTGMTANVWIAIASKAETLTVPAGAITVKDGTKTINVLENRTAVARVIETGLEDIYGNIEVTAGLKAGEVVILSEK
jgi:HlyD family secretion protein